VITLIFARLCEIFVCFHRFFGAKTRPTADRSRQTGANFAGQVLLADGIVL
jgi:hypothetical protein